MAERIESGARVYAEALYRAAADAGRVHEVDRDLQGFTSALAESREVLSTLLNPQLPRDAKRRIVAQMLSDVEPLVRNAMLVLVDNGRLGLLQDVQVALAEMAALEERILDVEVTTAVGLDKEALAALEQRISGATGLRTRLTPKVDPAIIGGLVMRARGVLLDASIKRDLDDLRRALLQTQLPVGSEA